ncbi:terminase small subunit [Erysipelothrix sp. D19-032]
MLAFLSDTMRGITSDLDKDTGELLKVPIKDKLKAAELLGKRHALFTEKIEHNGNDGRAIRINIVPDKDD